MLTNLSKGKGTKKRILILAAFKFPIQTDDTLVRRLPVLSLKALSAFHLSKVPCKASLPSLWTSAPPAEDWQLWEWWNGRGVMRVHRTPPPHHHHPHVTHLKLREDLKPLSEPQHISRAPLTICYYTGATKATPPARGWPRCSHRRQQLKKIK